MSDPECEVLDTAPDPKLDLNRRKITKPISDFLVFLIK
jgi:hypothetical protein